MIKSPTFFKIGDLPRKYRSINLTGQLTHL